MGSKKPAIVTGFIVVLTIVLTACSVVGDEPSNGDAIAPIQLASQTALPTPSAVILLPQTNMETESTRAVEEPVASTEVPTEPAVATPPTEEGSSHPGDTDRSAFVSPVGDGSTRETDTPTGEAPVAEAPLAEPPVQFAEGCLDATPVADVTIPDGAILNPEEAFTKIWRLRNTGSCEWNETLGELQWVFVNGEHMNGPSVVPITDPVPAGGEIDVTVELTAPSAPGTYEGRWQVRDPNGDPVGVVFWVLIKVPGEGENVTDVPADPAPANPPPSIRGVLNEGVWQEINGERDRHGLYQLAYNEKLAQAAQKHAKDCSTRGSCSHTGSDGSDEAVRVVREGYEGTVDESWAWSSSPAEAVFWWLDEVPPNDWHRRMLLSDYLREIGVGVAPAPSGGNFFIAVFGIPGH